METLIALILVTYVAYLMLVVLWMHLDFNPYLGLNGEAGEGLWVFLVTITIIAFPFLIPTTFALFLWVVWIGSGVPKSVSDANIERKRQRGQLPDWATNPPGTP